MLQLISYLRRTSLLDHRYQRVTLEFSVTVPSRQHRNTPDDSPLQPTALRFAPDRPFQNTKNAKQDEDAEYHPWKSLAVRYDDDGKPMPYPTDRERRKHTGRSSQPLSHRKIREIAERRTGERMPSRRPEFAHARCHERPIEERLIAIHVQDGMTRFEYELDRKEEKQCIQFGCRPYPGHQRDCQRWEDIPWTRP